MAMAQRCQCEHAAHFDRRGHDYGIIRNCERIKTAWGTFALCDGCRRAGHMQDTLTFCQREIGGKANA